MSAKSNYLENKIINAVLRNTAYTSPATVYAALYTVTPGEGDTGTEVTGGSYARQAVTFGAPTDGVASNSGAVTFTDLPAATIVAIGIRDASTGGNLLYFHTLSTVITTVGADLTFDIGDIVVSET